MPAVVEAAAVVVVEAEVVEAVVSEALALVAEAEASGVAEAEVSRAAEEEETAAAAATTAIWPDNRATAPMRPSWKTCIASCWVANPISKAKLLGSPRSSKAETAPRGAPASLQCS